MRSEMARRRRGNRDENSRVADHRAGRVRDGNGSRRYARSPFHVLPRALTRSSAIALTLRAVGGLTTAEIASAFMVPEATMAQRISRAKQSIKASKVPFRMPTPQGRGNGCLPFSMCCI